VTPPGRSFKLYITSLLLKVKKALYFLLSLDTAIVVHFTLLIVLTLFLYLLDYLIKSRSNNFFFSQQKIELFLCFAPVLILLFITLFYGIFVLTGVIPEIPVRIPLPPEMPIEIAAIEVERVEKPQE
jgi:heme/copper-type cytochrome/quinol oxidase subunit 2